MVYNIRYSEIFSQVYSVNAPDYDTAVSILDESLRSGAVEAPDEMNDSSFEETFLDGVRVNLD